ncbi:MAG: NADH-quinone oxidoreductase subunit L [Proteobacteria bacterium]|nr:NADH-quinone oxidoreductase subunit L [Pseudomonadota bacterium]
MYFALVLLPLAASVVAGLGGKRIGDAGAMAITIGGVVTSLLLSIWAFIDIAVLNGSSVEAELYTWISTGTLNLSFGVLIDKLTAVMLIVVTGVSAMVHIYSVGYMSHDPSRARFFSYLSLFTFMMLALITAPNMVQMFLGWEGVGLASYLLIGFWFKKESANLASMKAFIVTRVADVGLILAVLTTFAVFGTLSFSGIFPSLDTVAAKDYVFFGHSFPVLELIALFLLIGAMGKSAQFGFHTWLPDAMEGPTPVSALIHAATMVTAGVFLLARMSPLFEHAEAVLTLVAIVGAITAMFAASIGLVQRDIKRVIAYSTCSQLGYMFFACGISAYSAAIFHLMTHAFFKALLFLAAGSVIHAMSDEQDMFKMGGIRKYLPYTYPLMWIGSLALMGIPPFAGFFSKDFILEAAYATGGDMGLMLYIFGTAAALMTAFYSCRVMFLTFHGKPRASKEVMHHVHESPWVMVGPMMFLCVGAVLAGWLGHGMTDTHWWNGAIYIAEGHLLGSHEGLEEVHHIPLLAKFAPLVLVLFSSWVAYWVYIKRSDIPARFAKAVDPLYSWVMNKWYVDELYDLLFVRTARALGLMLWRRGDENTINRFGPDGMAYVTTRGSEALRRLQTGYIYHYAFILIVGVMALITWFIL